MGAILTAVVIWIVLSVHMLGWLAAASLRPHLHLAVQSVAVLAVGLAMLLASRIRQRVYRGCTAVALLAVFCAVSLALPLPTQFSGNGYMGDGLDLATTREHFERIVPLAGGHPEVEFKAYLADGLLAALDGAFHGNTPLAYQVLSRTGGLIFVLEILLVLALAHWSRRSCRFAALSLAAPLAVMFFGYYETGYLAASIGVFPLIVVALARRSAATLQWGGAIQGLHAALHGFGVLGICSSALAVLSAGRQQWSRWSATTQLVAFAATGYLGWVFIYTVLFKISLKVDQTVAAIALRGWTSAYWFDQRLVHPLSTWTAIAEVGCASLSAGVPAFACALAFSSWRNRVTRLAIAMALPALVFLIVWWPSAGVARDTDLFVGAFGAIGAAAWLASRSGRASYAVLALLAVCHLSMWSFIGSRVIERVWID